VFGVRTPGRLYARGTMAPCRSSSMVVAARLLWQAVRLGLQASTALARQSTLIGVAGLTGNGLYGNVAQKLGGAGKL
jgi:hypothetical protein